MASGMEMMLKNLLLSFGFKPDEIEKNIKSYAQALRDNLASLDANLKTINARLERIEQTLNISAPPNAENEEEKPLIVQQ